MFKKYTHSTRRVFTKIRTSRVSRFQEELKARARGGSQDATLCDDSVSFLVFFLHLRNSAHPPPNASSHSFFNLFICFRESASSYCNPNKWPRQRDSLLAAGESLPQKVTRFTLFATIRTPLAPSKRHKEFTR